MKQTIKSLVIKTASHVIYCVNGKVSCVRDAKTGRFVKIKKFAGALNGLFIAAKNASLAVSSDKAFFTSAGTKVAVRTFQNMAKMAIALLGAVRLYVKRNYAHDNFNFTVMNQYA